MVKKMRVLLQKRFVRKLCDDGNFSNVLECSKFSNLLHANFTISWHAGVVGTTQQQHPSCSLNMTSRVFGVV